MLFKEQVRVRAADIGDRTPNLSAGFDTGYYTIWPPWSIVHHDATKNPDAQYYIL